MKSFPARVSRGLAHPFDRSCVGSTRTLFCLNLLFRVFYKQLKETETYLKIRLHLFFTREYDLSYIRSTRVLNMMRKAVFTGLLAGTRNGNVRKSKRKHVLGKFSVQRCRLKSFRTFSKKLLGKQMNFEYLLECHILQG